MNDNFNEMLDENIESVAESEPLCETTESETTDADEVEENSAQNVEEQETVEENEDNSSNELDALREELCRLRAELEEKKSSLARLGKEISEFSELFPNEPLTSLPDSVWESVRGGVPLAAAYALYRRRTELRLEKADITNRKNNEMSTGAIGRDTTDNFYTPDEVRAMSRSEIKKNYSKILDSMKKWN